MSLLAVCIDSSGSNFVCLFTADIKSANLGVYHWFIAASTTASVAGLCD